MGRILVTPRSVTKQGHPSLARLAQAGHEVIMSAAGVQPKEDDLVGLLPGCIGYLAGVEPISARVLAAAPSLRVISRNGTGTDNIDLAAAATQGIRVVRAEGANARGVAELTIGLMFALVRDVPATDAALKRGDWTRRQGFEIQGRTLGLLGCGRIGQIVARLAGALEMMVLAYDPKPDTRFQPGAFFRFATAAEVASGAHILSLHCPPDPGGRPVVDADFLSRCRRGVYVINTARFDLMDPQALLSAIDSGHVAGLALDVFAQEPPSDWSLPAHPRVIATAHLGGFTNESVDRAMDAAVDNLLHTLAKENA